LGASSFNKLTKAQRAHMFKTLLIANRGEIACRISRTAQRLGMRAIAVYSDADAGALHTRVADAALRIGGAAARESYLNIPALLKAAHESGAQAVHPGYGFLAESAEFAKSCAREGIVFVGPSAEAIHLMGLKDQAKTLMQGAGVPVVPGYFGAEQDERRLTHEARAVGFPLLIKAVAGGGGKGMRIVRDAGELPAQLASARGEAERAFGDARVMLERFLEHARHVEVQIIADRHGNCLHLLERDCSLQRRHQKVIEEAPAPELSSALRTRLHGYAVAGARAVGYENAGTMEFVVAAEECFFLEMNTRLQVEHPVTEMILGIDLVEWQLRIAAGETLPLQQDEVRARGHAFEARVYAEDPRRGFLPTSGKLQALAWPKHSARVRIDAAVEAGDQVGTHYDALLAKLIVIGRDRGDALAQLQRALAACRIEGLTTNLAALIALASDAEVRAAHVFTRLIDERGAALLPDLDAQARRAAPLAALSLLAAAEGSASSPWSCGDAWALNGAGVALIRLQAAAGQAYAVRLKRRAGRWHIDDDKAPLDVEDLEVIPHQDAHSAAHAHLGGTFVEWSAHIEPERIAIWLEGEWHRFERVSAVADALAVAADGTVRAPMPGVILAVRVTERDRVTRGQVLIVMEAMKMEHTLTAGSAGLVTELRVRAGDRVRDGDALLKVTADAH
jgi:3-methylcrotonyl-CoA carboxylase alpha subunit